VDFNNKLAGRSLKYKYKIVSEPETAQDKLNAVLKMDYGTTDGFSAEFDEKKAVVKMPDVCKYDQRWLLSKYRVVTDLRELLDLEVIQFVEEYAKAEKKDEKVEETHEHSHEGHEHDHEHDHDGHSHEGHDHKAPEHKASKPKKAKREPEELSD